MPVKKRVLVVAAHPDDEVLGCGGAIAKYARSGCQVFVLILGEGATARYAKRRLANLEEVSVLRQQAKLAAGVLGVKKLFCDNLPDNRFDTVALLDVVKKIEQVKKDTQPDIVFTHHPRDLNIDHQLTARATVTAFRPLPAAKPASLYGFEVQCLKDWGAYNDKLFNPDFFLDISSVIELKVKALKCYSVELKKYPHPRSPQAVRIHGQYRGLACGKKYAEAFKTLLRVE